MTVGQFLTEATAKLLDAGIATAKLDCLILLEDELELNRARLLAHPEIKIPEKTEVHLNTKIAQRATHVPLAYIRGKAEFYGRMFIVTRDTLVPRPESESIIDLLTRLNLPANPKIADIGAGSGCLGVTAVLEIAGAELWLCDIDGRALEIAKRNAAKHGVTAHSLKADLLTAGLSAKIDVILANLPYVPERLLINEAAKHEPRLAIFAGDDGLVLFRKLWNQLENLSEKPSYVITESLLSQHVAMEDLAKHAGFQLSTSAGLAQRFETTQSAQHRS